MKAAELTLSSSCSQCILYVRSNVTGRDAEENWTNEDDDGRYLDALIVDSDVIKLKPDALNFDLWVHSGGRASHLRGRQDGAAL